MPSNKIKHNLTEGSILLTIIKASWPMIVAMLLHSSFNIVDAIFVGRISAEAIAAVSIAFPAMFLMFALAGGIGTGGTSYVARLIGAKNIKKAGNVAEHALLMGLVLGIIFSILGLLFGKYLFIAMGAGELLNLVLEYINIIFIGTIITFIFVITNSLIRGEGDMKSPMYFMATATILNIILDPIFIFALGWGLKGAAIATVVSNIIGCIIALRYLLSGKAAIKLDFRMFKYDFSIVKEIFRVGSVTSLSQASMAIGIAFLTKIVSQFGPYAIAAFGIGFRVEGIAILPALGMMAALMSIVGQNVGARKFERAEKTVKQAIVLVTLFTITIAIICLLFPRQIVLVFNNNPDVLRFGITYIRITALSYIFAGIGICISGAFIGAGKPLPSLMLTLLRVLIIAVPAAYLLSRAIGLTGVWIALLASSVISSIIAVIWFRTGSWKHVKGV